MNKRLKHVLKGTPVTDGAGIKLMRYLGTQQAAMLDPLLLLDHFAGEVTQEMSGGFPPHPHRGFETVSYMIAGRIRHKDSAGHEGVVETGGVQWMTAGKGVVHSEMPEQNEGRMEGIQLWINLPASHKMVPPKYQEFDAGQIPVDAARDGSSNRVIAGKTQSGVSGPIVNEFTHPIFMDVTLTPDEVFGQPIPENHNAAILVLTGRAKIDDDLVESRQLGIFGKGTGVEIKAGIGGARFVLLAGKPLNEQVARGGPFVMNTEAEVRQAFTDYQAGTL